MAVLLTNNAGGVLSAGITAAATTVALQTGQGALFPFPSGSNWFPATIYNALGAYEIVKCTARLGDALTIVRAQEGTAALAFNAGDKLDCRATAAAMANKLDTDTGGTVNGPLVAAGGITGNATTATKLATPFTLNLVGDVTGSLAIDGSSTANLTTTEAASGVTPGTYAFATVTVDAKGRCTAASAGTVAAATTTVAGITTLSTAALVQAGTDNVSAVTALSLAAGLTLGASGSVILPGGLILKWGVTSSLGSGTSNTVSFGTAFPNGCYSVVITAQSTNTAVQSALPAAGSLTASQFTLTTGAGASAYAWIAFGH